MMVKNIGTDGREIDLTEITVTNDKIQTVLIEIERRKRNERTARTDGSQGLAFIQR